MRWRRSKGWNRSFLGRKNAVRPERPVYLRTLSNLSNPSEVRGVLEYVAAGYLGTPARHRLTASQIEFAQQMLPFRYAEVVNLSEGGRSKGLLFAAQEGGADLFGAAHGRRRDERSCAFRARDRPARGLLWS